MIKKIILTMCIALFCLCNIPYTFAEQHTDSNNSISDIAPKTEATQNDSQEQDNSNQATQQDVIGNMLLQAVSLMGIPYKWGGNTPETGMDCSGLIRYVYQKSLGITLPRTAAEMAKVGKRISISDIKPGDLLFFNTLGFNSSHIGLYLGNNQFLQSQKTGTDIHITELSGYWKAHFNGAKRIVEENNNTTQTYANIRNEPLPVSKYASHRQKKRNSRLRKKTTRKITTHKLVTTAKKKSSTKKVVTHKVIKKSSKKTTHRTTKKTNKKKTN